VATLHFHGHSCFEIVEGEHRVLIDPFLAPSNPKADASAAEIEPTHILLTHGHFDHTADVVEIAKRTGADCVAIVELARWIGAQGVEGIHDPNLGGTVEFEWGTVKLVPALHTNTAPDNRFGIGTAAGLVIRIADRTIYHLGDTCLFSDLSLIADREGPIDVAIVPIGGHFTMDRHDAAYACGLIGAKRVVPCHYDTFPKIETDVEAFRTEVDETAATGRVEILRPGEALEL
jgi:L-ascorbate metabolism protein UlaG (beta-lactamase superfamily)